MVVFDNSDSKVPVVEDLRILKNNTFLVYELGVPRSVANLLTQPDDLCCNLGLGYAL
jgi:hypothetical protein